MTMHCPNCRRDNASTTRFCTACGAVLVESTPGGGRRRVLRPWGLRGSAPLTESPAMPDIAAARREAQRAGGPQGRRVDLMFAGGVVLVAMAGLLVYPYAKADETTSFARLDDRPATHAASVPVPPLSTVRETLISAPPLVEPLSVPPPAPKARPVKTPAEGGQRQTGYPAAGLAVPVTYPLPARESIVIDDGRSVDPPAPPPEESRAPADPWQALRDSIGACARSANLWERATCEQGARLAHCDGHWGNVALCPAGRTEFGQ
jgi:hypothetical protein